MPARFAPWLFGDPGRRLAVWAAWAFMAATAGGYVWCYAPDLPVNDEWAFVPQLFADADTQLKWVFEPHAEHRYPLARLLYLGVLHGSGNDFRGGMWVTVGMLALASGLFIASARFVRGRTEFTDAWFPVLLLHRGHFENLLMGYQIAFTLTVAAAAALVWVAVRAKGWTANRVGWAGAVLLLLIAPGGGIGLLVAPFVGGWLAWRLTFGRTGPLGVGGWVGLLTGIVAAGYVLWGVSDSLASPQPKPPKSLAMIWTGVRTLEVTFGPAVCSDSYLGGLLLLAGGAVAVPYLGWRAWKEPASRGGLLGVLAVCGAVLACAAAVAVSRENAISSRYACLSALAPCAVAVGLAGRLPAGRWWRVVFALLTLAGGAALVRQNWQWAKSYGQRLRAGEDDVRADVAAGMPLNLLAERHRYYWVYPHPDVWHVLAGHGVGPTKGVAPPDTTFPLVPLPAPTADPSDDPHVERFLVWKGDERVAAVRVWYTCPEQRIGQPFRFRWITADADGTEREHESVVRPWLAPGPGCTTQWVNGRLRAVWLEVGRTHPLPLDRAELLRPHE